MTELRRTVDFRRILVALDASGDSLAALEAAATLAGEIEAEILGLFIEDIDLLNLAALPFSREARRLSANGGILDPAQIERELRGQQVVARRALERVATTRRLRWSFRVVRGRVETELLLAAEQADLVAVGKGSRPISGAVKLGSTARMVGLRTLRSVLFVAPAEMTPDCAIAVVYDSGRTGTAALDVGARLAAREHRRLIVIVMADGDEEAARLEQAAAGILRSLGTAASMRRAVTTRPEPLIRALKVERAGLVVVPADSATATDEQRLRQLVEKSSCSVLLVRGLADLQPH